MAADSSTIFLPSSSTASALMLAAITILSLATLEIMPVSAQAPAPGPGLSVVSRCFNVLISAADCVTYLSPGSNLTDPGSLCCNETNALINSVPDGGFCLCELLARPNDSPLPVDVNQAWKLPSSCGFKVNPVTLCRSQGVEVQAPPGLAPTPVPVRAAATGQSPRPAPPASRPAPAPAPAPAPPASRPAPAPAPPALSASSPPTLATNGATIIGHLSSSAFVVGLAISFLASGVSF